MSNELKVSGKLVLLGNIPLTLPKASSDPGSGVAGDLYYNTTSDQIKYYNGTTWSTVTTGSVSLVGQPLLEDNIIVGDPSNQSYSIDTGVLGNIHVTSVGGLVIKSDTIVNSQINSAAAISYSKLSLSNSIVNADVNSSAAIAYSKLNLSASIVDADINSAAAIAYSKLSLSNHITNSDINASAAIAYSKLALTASIVNADVSASAAITYSKLNLSSSITNSDINASAAIAYSKLSLSNSLTNSDINASAAIAYSKLNLSASIVNADVSASAAIAYSKLALTSSIVNADISASAAITYSKLSLANSIVNADVSPSAAIAYSKLSLTNHIVDADINASAAISYSKLNLSASIVDADVSPSAAIAYSKLALSASIVNADISASAAIAYSKLSLTNHIVDADINASAAISYSKLNLSASIVNADISASAAIAYSKLAALTANKALASDGSGHVSATSVTSTELGYVSGVTSAIQTQLNHKIQDDGSVAFAANQPMGGFKLTGLAAGSGAGDSVRYEQAILVSGVNSFASDQSMGSHKLTNVTDPSAAQDAATKFYVDSKIAGLSWKQAVHVASVGNVNVSSAPSAIDGHTLNSLERILLKNQSAPEENGIYVFNGAGNPLTRSSDAATWDEIVAATVYVEQGSTNSGSKFVNTNISGGTLGVDPISFAIFSSAGTVTGTGTTGYIAYWNSASNLTSEQYLSASRGGLATDASSFTGVVKATAGSFSASSIVNADVSASAAIAYSKLNLSASIVNADVSASAAIVYSKLSLSNSITNSDINASAAIAYSKLNLSASIVNADINASAAIALSKLAALSSHNRVLVSDGSGIISESSVTSTTLGFLDATSSIQTQLNGKANTALSNLASVAINASLLPATDNSIDLGSSSKSWANTYTQAINNPTSGNALVISTTGSGSSVDVKSNKVRRSDSPSSSNFIEEQYFDALTLAAATGSATAISSLTFSDSSYAGAELTYTIKQSSTNEVRVGRMIVSQNGVSTSSSETFSETADIGIVLSAAINAGNVEIRFTNSDPSNASTMRVDVKRFRL